MYVRTIIIYHNVQTQEIRRDFLYSRSEALFRSFVPSRPLLASPLLSYGPSLLSLTYIEVVRSFVISLPLVAHPLRPYAPPLLPIM